MWTSPYEPIDLDGPPLPDLVRRTDPRAALVDAATGGAVSYPALAERVRGVAAGLAARGFGAGDVLAVWAPNQPAWAEVALGAMTAGGAVTGISPLATERDAASQLARSGASVLVTAPPCAAAAHAAAATAGLEWVEAIDGLLERRVGPAEPDEVDGQDGLALLPCSSGTTGLPKLVMLTHRNLAAAVAQVRRGLDLQERDVVLGIAPYAHVMGFVAGLAAPLAAGATVVVMPRFELGGLLAAVERHRATVLIVPPPVMAALAHHPAVAGHDLSTLELIVSGGAPLGAELQQAVAARLPHAAVRQGYGMTETTLPIPIPDRHHASPPGSVGRLAPSTELRVVDPGAGEDLGPGEHGELWVRGPQITPGYLGRPDATAELIDAAGWLRTGDLGWVDEDGHVFVVDRLKELIKVNALQVAPAELEALLTSHPQVADAAVIPRPDERTGEVPVAFVVARGPLDGGELMAWVAARVARYKRLGAVRVVEAIPRTPAGKILRRVLIEEDRERAPASV